MRRGGCLWLLVGLFLALVAGGMAFSTMLRATTAQPVEQTEPRAPVVVVARNLPPRTKIQPADVELAELPISTIPNNAVRSLDEAIGKVTTGALVAGEILLAPRIADLEARGPQVAFELQPGKVVMALPAADLMSQSGVLKPGDKVDILVTVRLKQPSPQDPQTQEEVPYTFATLQQVTISAIIMPPEAYAPEEKLSKAQFKPQAVLVALDPQDALVLKHLKDTGGTFDLVLRAPEDDTEFGTVPVHPPYLKERYRLGEEMGR